MFGSFSRLVVVNYVEDGDVHDGHVEGSEVYDDVHAYEGNVYGGDVRTVLLDVLMAMAKYALPWMKLVIAIEVLRVSETPTLGWSKAKRNM